MSKQILFEKDEDASNEEILEEEFNYDNLESEEFDDDGFEDNKYRLIYDKTYIEQLKYLYPEERLLKKAKKVYSASIKCTKIVLTLIFFGAFLLNLLFSLLDIEIWFTNYLVPVAIFIAIGITVYTAIVNNKLQKEQYAILKQNESKYHLQISLHDIRKAHTKRINKVVLFAVLFYAVAIGVINLLDYLLDLNKDLVDSLFLGGFGLLVLLIIAFFVLAYTSYKKMRLKMIIEENEIDKLTCQSTDIE